MPAVIFLWISVLNRFTETYNRMTNIWI